MRQDDPPEEQAKGFVPEIVRRAVLTGVGALFMTEEGIRNLTRIVTQEVRRFLEGETLRREIWRLLTSVTLEVNATVQLKPSGEPHIKAKVKARKREDEGE